jgi:hypothetical protein
MPSGPLRLNGAPSPPGPSDAPSFRLLVGTQAVPVDQGESILGRGEECRIVVLHSTVSRRHARLVLEGTRLTVEDLDSANGTYVNRARVHGRIPLKRGDWIALGTFEIEVLQGVPDDPDSDGEDRATPISGVAVLGQVPLSSSLASVRGAETERRRAPLAGAETLESAARLADRVLAAGRAQAAEQILAEPIVNILAAARSGAIPDAPTIDAFGRSALKLANATVDGRWVDAAVELHLVSGRPMRIETLRQLALLRGRARVGDDALIARYYETLRSRLSDMSPGERTLVELVADLIPGLDRSR